MQYTARIAHASFIAWARSPEGRPVLEKIGARSSFALFGRTRAARRRIWRQLNEAARAESVVVRLQEETDAYLARLDTLAHAQDLPQVIVDQHRLVAVPRMFANAEAYRRIDAVLSALPAFAAVEGSEFTRGWFVLTLVNSIQRTLARVRPSPRHPLPAGDRWVTVGINEQFEWWIPFNGPAWPGHYYVLEVAPTPMTRALRKRVGDTIARLETTLPALSRPKRNEILRQAGSSVDRLFARA